MIFEEFFKKKKIDLIALAQGEPALFLEFKAHYEQMGEKSFDHTKKYWFNKLRLRFPAAIETKTEKAHIDNPIAEQTITESLIESSTPSPNIGFKPKFRAGLTKPAETSSEPKEEKTDAAEPVQKTESATPPPNIGFKPKFRAGVAKPADPLAPKEDLPALKPEDKPEELSQPPSNIGFKPRFKAGITKSTDPAPGPAEEPKSEPEVKPEETATPPPNTGFKPRFKAGVTKPAAPEQKEGPKKESE